MEITACSNRVLEARLDTETFSVIDISAEDRAMYLGGKGLALKLLYDRLTPGMDPLGKENIIVFMTGALGGTAAPCSGRFSAVTKSPLTGFMVSSSCGGPFGNALKSAGWDGIIVRGKAKKPAYLVVDQDGIEFRSAAKIWGKDSQKSQELLCKEGEGTLAIGRAGENMVLFANISSGERFLGRGGMGAVMGSKNLKGITVKGGEHKIVPANKESFEKARKKLLSYINANGITSGSYRSFGTNANMNLSNAGGILPVRNFTGGTHDMAYAISGEVMAEEHATKHHTCRPCSILCGHLGTFNGKTMAVPEYETAVLMGSNLGIFDADVIARWNEICALEGMDTISAGNTIGWAMEAAERGMMKSPLRFGSPKGVDEALRDTAMKKGIGKELAMGTRRLSEKYGGRDFAMEVKGMEMSGYDPRGSWGQGLSYAVANRGACHLSASVFAMEVFLGMSNPLTVRGKGEMVKFFENVFSAVNSLHICQFTAYAVFLEPPLVKYSPKPMLKLMVDNLTGLALSLMDISAWPALWSAATGMRLTSSSFKRAGERIHVLERLMNCREGMSGSDDTLPGRILSESRDCDPGGGGVPLERMLGKYYRARGFDNEGIPLDATLARLGIGKGPVTPSGSGSR